jgi:Ca-activated chloride channel family protein
VIFAEPWFLALGLPAAALLLWARGRGGPVVDGGSARVLSGLPRSWRVRSAWLPSGVLSLAVALIIVALARPQQGREETKVLTEGIDIMLVVDISSSMTQAGLEKGVSNIDVVRSVVTDFVEARTDDRLGLVSFARLPRTVCPLTLDNSAVLQHLKDLKCVQSNGPDDGTAIGAALGHAARKLRESEAASKIVVLLTDGVENQYTIAVEDTAALCKDLGIKVYTVGAGVALSADVFGNVHESKMDTSLLEFVADKTGGQFFRARTAKTLERVYEAIDELEKTEREDLRYTDYEDLYSWLLGAAAALLVLQLLLHRGPYLESAS